VNDLITQPQRFEDEAAAEAAGVTWVLTDQGWEDSDYIEPADDWTMLEDGSYQSPDGLIRTTLLTGSEPE
jgi:hypothetical protein